MGNIIQVENVEPESEEDLGPVWMDPSIVRLMSAIIGQAARDALREDEIGAEARDWLLGEECKAYCDCIGLAFLDVEAWVLAGCPNWQTRILEE